MYLCALCVLLSVCTMACNCVCKLVQRVVSFCAGCVNVCVGCKCVQSTITCMVVVFLADFVVVVLIQYLFFPIVCKSSREGGCFQCWTALRNVMMHAPGSGSALVSQTSVS